MKKHRNLILILLVAVVALTLCFVACDKVKEAIMDAPENIRYDGEYLTWDKVEADYYTVSINGGEAQRANSTAYAYQSKTNFDVTVTAVKGDASKGTSKSFHYLAPVATINVRNNGELYWDAVGGANAYEIQVNGTSTGQVTDTSYTALAAGGNRVKVKPVVSGDDSFYSDWSAEKYVNVYVTPSNLSYDGTSITWQGNAPKYEVIVNGQAKTVNETKMAYNSESKDFTVSIKAIGDYVNNFDSAVAEESFAYLDTVTDITVEEGILKWQAVDNAKGYKVKVGATVNVVSGTEFSGLTAGQSLDVSVLPYNDEGNYFSYWSATKTVYVLSVPSYRWNNDLELDTEANNNFVWDAVPAAAGYTVKVTSPDGNTETLTYGQDQRAYANLYEAVGVYTVRVKANSDVLDTDRYDSKFSDPITIERLAAPRQTASNFIVSDANSLASGFTVNFIGVNGATGYQLYKDGVALNGLTAGPDGAAITDNNVVATTVTSEQNFTYMVQTLGGVSTTDGLTYVKLPSIKSTSLSFNIVVQQQPQGLTASGYNAFWNAVGGSNGYVVSYGGQTYTSSTESYNLKVLSVGRSDFAVCARGDGAATLASNFTATLEIRKLDYPRNIRIVYGEGNGLLQYDDVSNATGYSVFVGENYQALDQQSWDEMYKQISENGTVISMSADANTFNVDNTVYFLSSDISPTQTFVRLAAPTFPEGALSNQSEIRWNAPDNINTNEYTPTYVVKFSDTTVAQRNGTSYNLSQLEAGNYVFTIRAVGDDTHYLDSEYTYVGKSFTKLATPTMSVESDGYHWNAVPSASAYYVEIDGARVFDEDHVAGKEYVRKPNYSTIGQHTVRLSAIGNGINTVSSNAYEYTQVVEQLQRPEISASYSNPDGFVIGGSIIATVTTATPHAVNYQYEIAGKSSVSSELTASQVMDSQGLCSVKVKALGGVIENEIYYTDSLYSAENTIILLAQPSLADFQMSADGIIMWKNVTNANGYDYQIKFDGGEFSSVAHLSGSSLTVDKFRQYTNITIRVRSSANGSPYKVNSTWTEWTWTNSNVA